MNIINRATVFLTLLLLPVVLFAQQPQTQTAPNFDVNAQYVDGFSGGGYAPSKGSGLTLNLGAGTSICSSSVISYAGGTLSMTDNTTNYVYLNQASSCVPASSTSSSVFVTNFPVAVITTLSGAITVVSDVRTVFSQAASGGGSGTVNNCSAQYSFAEYLLAGTAVGCGPVPPSVNGSYLCEYNVTGSAALAPSCPLLGLTPRGVTGSTDTILYSDNASLVDYYGTGAVAITLPTATTLGNANFYTVISNKTSGPGGSLTVTPTTWTINGISTLTVVAGQECRINTDPASATNWLSQCSSSGLTRSFGTTFGDTGGSALTSGSVVYFTVPYACTIAAWNISVDAGTVTFDIWKIATGTAIPTAANSITASALPALSTGTHLHSTTMTSWTLSVAANDIFGIQLNTVATAKFAEVDIQCNQ